MTESPYLRLVREHRGLIGFGFAMALASSFGQTYFIGVFGQEIQVAFGLSHTGWGAVYLVGTLASALFLPWTGELIDRVALPRYAIAVAAAFVLACVSMALTVGVITLTLSIFLLRQAGQGLASHTSITTMARYFDRDRGRAIAVAALGFSVGEALLPVVAVVAIGTVGWRATYGVVATILALTLVPMIVVSLRQLPHPSRGPRSDDGEPTLVSMTRGEVLRDLRFYLLLPGIVAPAFVVTALFFHHLNLADAKGWTHVWLTGNYVVFAAASTVVALVCGPAIDRLGATRLVPLMLVPMIGSLIAIATIDHPLVVWLYFGLLGSSIGIAHTAVTAMWAELYGVEYLGAIRSMVTALAVFASALGPVALGALMDASVSIEHALLLFACYAGLATILMIAALRRGRRTS